MFPMEWCATLVPLRVQWLLTLVTAETLHGHAEVMDAGMEKYQLVSMVYRITLN
jgi:hypothetical protein